jgi:hypothetical protein
MKKYITVKNYGLHNLMPSSLFKNISHRKIKRIIPIYFSILLPWIKRECYWPELNMSEISFEQRRGLLIYLKKINLFKIGEKVIFVTEPKTK